MVDVVVTLHTREAADLGGVLEVRAEQAREVRVRLGLELEELQLDRVADDLVCMYVC